ncbi:hypothetical protein GCM10011332_32870 [Terasakiella brassicae]|uniref:Uncharacterized protein n=1 Tax=Terasakiella brassicae TaxID=1634917 RepID=A0A917C7S9_9PROT|nr:hypothetical protein [Terasakiella brassicae]GGF75227.1 hypothetical protein GCM10011332_31540 [Terasakiella brassicae]GGF76336.1 hypothetical protein GCM10011332_32870 [Terasakiella brassicae]
MLSQIQSACALERIKKWSHEDVEDIIEDVYTIIGQEMLFVHDVICHVAITTGRDEENEDLTDGVIATDKKGNKIVFTYSTEIQKVDG